MKIKYQPFARASTHRLFVYVDTESFCIDSMSPVFDVKFSADEARIEYAALDATGGLMYGPVPVEFLPDQVPTSAERPVAQPVTTYRRAPPPPKPEPKLIIPDQRLSDTKVRWRERMKAAKSWAFFKKAKQ
jgi:hypothetical protein